MNAAMPMFRSLMLSVLRRFMNREQATNGAPHGAAAKTVRNPQLSAVLAVLAVVYAVSPIDLLPDVIPIIGWIDDGLVLWFGLSQALKAMGRSAAPSQTGSTVIETTATRVA